MISMLFLYIVHSIFLTIIQNKKEAIAIKSVQLVLYIASDDPCEIKFTVTMCFCFRLPTTACLLSFVGLQFSIMIERVVALWKRCKYDQYGSRIGVSLTVASIIPFYTLVSPILILFIIKWSQQLRAAKLRQLMKRLDNERDAYFKTYTEMWKNHIRKT
ncbi:hypothetical protein ANCCAN_07303 [Ancylostoma caninum]|uniref:Uncharacterized protein n=1 Tax=Ancylostoma caninum TaxID=29170 RepID=A0A368GQR0_ANCCA|nr:hypothetical protein ANCCAN_07303 [Ancylostoma caninum]